MEPNVMLKIEGQQWSDAETPQAIRLTTEGLLYRHEGCWFVEYEEGSASGMEGAHTTLKVADDGRVTLLREGMQGLDLDFATGTRHITRMSTPYGELDVEVYTSLVESKVDAKGGYIRLGYTIELNKREQLNTRLDVSIRKRQAETGPTGTPS